MLYLSKESLLSMLFFLFCAIVMAQESLTDSLSMPDPNSFAALQDSVEEDFYGGGNPSKALVIGIADYKHAEKLGAAVNDARAMAGLFRKNYWYVAGYENLQTKQSFVKVVKQFKDQLGPNDQAILYFSGHGFQYNGKNYLVPAGANIQTVADIEKQAYALDIEHILGKAKCKVVILDACRNNLQPSTRPIQGLTQGLKIMTADVKPATSGNRQNPDISTSGTLIVYASAFGKPAIIGKVYSVFTGALYTVLQKSPPCTNFTDVLQETRGIVVRQTRQRQVPWDSSSLTGKFVLKPCQ